MYRLLTFAIIIFTYSNSYCQSHLSVGVSFVKGFEDKSFELWNEEISDFNSYGYTTFIEYTYDIHPKYSLGFEAGGKRILSRGHLIDQEFVSKSYRMLLGISGYYIPLPKLKIGLGLRLVNNRDFANFRNFTSDLFRNDIAFKCEYDLKGNWNMFVYFNRILKKSTNAYLISNPPNQMDVGIKYTIF